MALVYPKYIHGELMTHRCFSRNARSSRAVPVAKILREVFHEPVLPIVWGSNKPGMQAGNELPRMLMCRAHWRMVPKPLQDRVWATYRPGQEVDRDPSAAWFESAEATIRAVADKEDRLQNPQAGGPVRHRFGTQG